jgi:hypothetical protein
MLSHRAESYPVLSRNHRGKGRASFRRDDPRARLRSLDDYGRCKEEGIRNENPFAGSVHDSVAEVHFGHEGDQDDRADRQAGQKEDDVFPDGFLAPGELRPDVVGLGVVFVQHLAICVS